MASLSGVESEYNLPLGGDIPDNNVYCTVIRTMRRKRSSPRLTEHSFRSRYSAGTLDRSICSSCNTEQDTEGHADNNTKHDNIHSRKKQCSGASLCWDCWRESQGCPKTTGAKGESVRRKEIVSVWLPEVMRLTDSVTWVTGGRD